MFLGYGIVSLDPSKGSGLPKLTKNPHSVQGLEGLDELPSRNEAKGRKQTLGGRDAAKSPKPPECRRIKGEQAVVVPGALGNLDPSGNPTLGRRGQIVPE